MKIISIFFFCFLFFSSNILYSMSCGSDSLHFFNNILTLKKLPIALELGCNDKNDHFVQALNCLKLLISSHSCRENPCPDVFCSKKIYKFIMNPIDTPSRIFLYRKQFATSARMIEGERLVVSSWSPNIEVLHLKDGLRREVFGGHTGSVWNILKINASTIASASQDGLVGIWDLEKNKCLQILGDHESGCKATILLKDKKIVTASGSGAINIWSGSSYCLKKKISAHVDSVCALAELGNGILVSSSLDRTIKIWDVKYGCCMQEFNCFNHCAYALINFTGEEFFAGLDNHTIIVGNARTGKVVRTFVGHTRCVRSLVMLKNLFLASSSMDGTIKLWDAWSGRCLQTIICGDTGVISLNLLGNGNLLTVAVDGSIHIVELYPKEVQALFQHEDWTDEKLKTILLAFQLNIVKTEEKTLVLHHDWKDAFDALPACLKEKYKVFFCD